MPLTAAQIQEKDTLIRKRATIKGRITKVAGILEAQSNNPDVHVIQANMDRLEKTISELEACTEALIALEPNGNHSAEQETIESDYTELLSKAYRLKDKARPSTSQNTGISQSSSPNPFALHQPTFTRLPEQNLPKFSGKYEEWLSFQDDFESTIGRRAGLSDTDKLKYLRTCLRGEPERLVKQFETTEDGYRNAWALLKKTFEDRGRIRERHVSEIFNVPAMQKESAPELSRLINSLELHRAALKSLSEDTFSTMMLCIALSKIDKSTRKHWRMTLKEDELPTYDDLISFLRRMVITTDEPLIAFTEDRVSKPRNGSQNSHTNNKESKQARSFATTASKECPICNNNHPLFQCGEFKKLSAKDKYQAASRASVCINCLRPGHNVKQCTSSFTCKTCQGKHHTWLHFGEPATMSSEASGSAPSKSAQS